MPSLARKVFVDLRTQTPIPQGFSCFLLIDLLSIYLAPFFSEDTVWNALFFGIGGGDSLI
jgi:hypothetical protein